MLGIWIPRFIFNNLFALFCFGLWSCYLYIFKNRQNPHVFFSELAKQMQEDLMQHRLVLFILRANPKLSPIYELEKKSPIYNILIEKTLPFWEKRTAARLSRLADNTNHKIEKTNTLKNGKNISKKFGSRSVYTGRTVFTQSMAPIIKRIVSVNPLYNGLLLPNTRISWHPVMVITSMMQNTTINRIQYLFSFTTCLRSPCNPMLISFPVFSNIKKYQLVCRDIIIQMADDTSRSPLELRDLSDSETKLLWSPEQMRQVSHEIHVNNYYQPDEWNMFNLQDFSDLYTRDEMRDDLINSLRAADRELSGCDNPVTISDDDI
jgi:hypothetical protein